MLSVFDGIPDQVQQNLAHPQGINFHHGQLLRTFNRQRQMFFFDFLFKIA